MTFPLPKYGHLTSYGVGLFSTDSHFGFEDEVKKPGEDEGKRFYIDIGPVPKKMKEKGLVDADAIGVFCLLDDEDNVLAEGELHSADINYTIFPTDKMPSELVLRHEGKWVSLQWDDTHFWVVEEQ